MNKTFKIILIIALLLIAINMVACGEHVHTYSDKVVAPTCVEQGYTEHTCTECGYYMRDTITPVDPKNHTLTKTETVAPTCQPGYSVYVCDVCSAEVIKDYKNPVHSFGEWNLDAVLCVTGGIYYRECTNPECGQKEEKIEKGTVHEPDNTVFVDATELNSGYLYHYCDCGEEYYSDEFTVPTTYDIFNFELCKEYDKDGNLYEYYVVKGFKGDEVANVVIPYEVGNIPVTVIDFEAFMDCDTITSVVLTDNLTNIQTDAFRGCDNLYNFVFTGTIEDWTSIAKGSEWTQYVTEKCVEIEGEHYGFNSYEVAPTKLSSGYVQHYCACGAYGHKDQFVPTKAAEALKLQLSEDGTYWIVVGCFEAEISSNLVIPYDYEGLPIKEIYVGAFSDCTKIQTITLTSNITMIRAYAFSGCEITKITFVGTEDELAAINNTVASRIDFSAITIVYSDDK